MPKLDPAAAPPRLGSRYPLPFRLASPGRIKRALGDLGGLGDFGVNLVELPPGEWSSQRHWHRDEDEFLWLLEGELVLIEEEGETLLRAGDCAAFPKGVANGHHCVNRSAALARYLEVGTRAPADCCTYPDVDLHLPDGAGGFTRKDGSPYPPSA